MTTDPQPARDQIRPELLEQFRLQFEACIALDVFTEAHRPETIPKDPAERIVLWTYARSTKTFRGSVRLCSVGYHVPAGMLNRSLYEDMLMAHWAKRHPTEAPALLERHETWSLDQWHIGLLRQGFAPTGYPELTEEERRELNRQFRGKTWTGLTLEQVFKDVRELWHGADRDRLERLHDLTHRFNNTLLHHGARALTLAAVQDPDTGALRFDAGPSDTHIWGSLLGAFYSFAETSTLVFDGELLDDFMALYREHLPAFLEKSDSGSPTSAQ